MITDESGDAWDARLISRTDGKDNGPGVMPMPLIGLHNKQFIAQRELVDQAVVDILHRLVADNIVTTQVVPVSDARAMA